MEPYLGIEPRSSFLNGFADRPHDHSGSTALVRHPGNAPGVSRIRTEQITFFPMPGNKGVLAATLKLPLGAPRT